MGDSYRPARGPPRDRDERSAAGRVTFSGGGSGDHYRPGDRTQSQRDDDGRRPSNYEFTFSSDRKGPQFPPVRSSDSNQPPPTRRRGGNHGRGRGRGRRSNLSASESNAPAKAPEANGGRRDRDRNGRRGGRVFHAPHERPLLQTQGAASPEHVFGATDGSSKFHAINDLSESEAEMDLDNDQVGDDQNGEKAESNKKARAQAHVRADGSSVPQWSNPDPYTALPPPDETTGKKTDFVALIRKAKKQAEESATSRNAVAANDDFISFGDDDAVSLPNSPPPPRGPRNSGPSAPPSSSVPTWQDTQPIAGSLNDAMAAGAIPNTRNGKRSAEVAGLPKKPPQSAKSGPKRKRGELEGALLQEWQPGLENTMAPWCMRSSEYSHLHDQTSKWLHNEILDFYDYVKPDPHETQVRDNLMKRIEQILVRSSNIPYQGRIVCFGSFPAGLYLPTADMDCVYVSTQYFNGGSPRDDFNMKKLLWAAARRLEQGQLATQVTVIAKAKVPIIKFVDRVTGIKVDLSFENLSGVAAQRTFQEWKLEYPDMPYLVALIKQFLLMRGLNDVHLGGLGGFSIICLAVSACHLHPNAENLGALFLSFLDFFGNKFDIAKQRISMKPIALLEKDFFDIDGRKSKEDGLSIQDPTNSENNISGGSNKAREVLKLFAKAHQLLQKRMTDFSTGTMSGSILEPILGGNYRSYDFHRSHIKKLK